MSTEQREFTPPSRENDLTDVFGLVFGSEGRPYSQSHLKQVKVKASRERDRDSRTRLVLYWVSKDGSDPTISNFEHAGRYFVRQLALDNVAQLVGAERGAAKSVKRDEVRLRKIRLFKKIQGQREDALSEEAFEALCQGNLKKAKDDGSLWALLGGLQDFTAGP